MQTIKIKPLSVNNARQWKRFKSKLYKQYEKIFPCMLKPLDIPKWKLRIDFIFWFSNSCSDYDNPIKPTQDMICKKYKIQDNRFYFATQRKVIVKKWQEFVSFKITKFDEN